MGHPRKPEVNFAGKWREHYNRHWEDFEENVLADDLLEWWLSRDWADVNEQGIPNRAYMNDFFLENMVSLSTVRLMCKRNPYFNYIYQNCRDIEEGRWFKLGCRKGYNPVMFLVGLKARYKWDDGTLYTSQDQKKLIIEDSDASKLEVTPVGVIEAHVEIIEDK